MFSQKKVGSQLSSKQMLEILFEKVLLCPKTALESKEKMIKEMVDSVSSSTSQPFFASFFKATSNSNKGYLDLLHHYTRHVVFNLEKKISMPLQEEHEFAIFNERIRESIENNSNILMLARLAKKDIKSVSSNYLYTDPNKSHKEFNKLAEEMEKYEEEIKAAASGLTF